MPKRIETTGSELFIVDNSDVDWKVLCYQHDWRQISKALDIATGCFRIGALLASQECSGLTCTLAREEEALPCADIVLAAPAQNC